MEIRDYALILKLANIKNKSEEMIKEARINDMSYEDFLINILREEVELREKNRMQTLLKTAKFPYKLYLEDYSLNHLEIEIKQQVKRVMELDFINKKENILLFGNPGVGKTHLAIGLGIKACLENKSVLFISVPNLMIDIKEAMNLNQIQRYKKNFEKYDLVILDELGYITFEKEASEVLFNLLSNRNDKGSIVLTTNLTFERWNEVFKDQILTAAIIDRLAHKSHIIDLSGESFRAKETLNWLSKSN